MKMKLIILLLFLSFSPFAFNPNNLFQDDLTFYDSLKFNFPKKLHSASQQRDHLSFLSDPDNLISPDFDIPSSLLPRVSFWFNIYTKYNSYFSVIHDLDNLSLIYDTIDFSDIVSHIKNKNTRYGIQNKALRGIISQYKDAFLRLAQGKCHLEKCLKIESALKKEGVLIPLHSKKRSAFFLKLKNNIRTQTGQMNHIQQGLINLNGHNESIENIFKVFKLPHELLAISFLESSFNIYAKSKVGATGPWQFMRRVGKHFMKVNRYVDQRQNALLSTSAALHLLKQNKKIMKYWDLAINSYNSGTGLLRKGVSTLKKKGIKNPRVPDLINHFQDKNWRFAAKNFYSEFLALVYTLAYRNKIFSKNTEVQEGTLKIYLTKCRLPLYKFIISLRETQPLLLLFNNHLKIKNQKTFYPKGTIIISQKKLTKKKYFEVEYKNLKNYFPKKLQKLVRRQNCSRR